MGGDASDAGVGAAASLGTAWFGLASALGSAPAQAAAGTGGRTLAWVGAVRLGSGTGVGSTAPDGAGGFTGTTGVGVLISACSCLTSLVLGFGLMDFAAAGIGIPQCGLRAKELQIVRFNQS